MSNDNKTLADVQPGGMVRLGEQTERARFEAWHCEKFKTRWLTGAPTRDMHNGVYAENYGPAEQQARWELWQAAWKSALSAQPSPGGQGDSRSEKAATFLRQYLTYLRSSPRQGLRPRWCDVYEALEVAIEALAARQPVGEPVGQVRTRVDGGFIAELLPGVADRVSNLAPLYTAPPAQQPAQVYLDGLDHALGEAIDQRDRYHEVADDLAGHIAAITGVDIGEHSSANCPWQNAIDAAEEYKPAQAVDLGQLRELAGEMDRFRTKWKTVSIAEFNHYADRLLALIDKAPTNG